MFTGSRATLLLVVWVFWIGSGLFALYGTYAYLSSGNHLTPGDIVSTALSICYLVGGLALAFKLDALLPRYRAQIIRLVTIGFCINVVFALWGMSATLQDPSRADGENIMLFTIAMSMVSIAIGFLIYKIIVNSINAVSHVPAAEQTRTQTIVYWVIVIAFFATMLIAILWDPTTNSFNVL